ncbi:Uncharacterised protein [Enterobacter cloacae]|nr:Uncharacterised protein [Enterobacter cloacae]
MLERLERGGQHQVIHIIGNKGVVGGANAKLHGQVKAGGGFTAARHAEQNHLRLVEIAQGDPVVVRQGVVNGGNTRIVFGQVAGVQPVGTVGDRRWVELQLALQGSNQRLHDVLTEALALQNDVADLRDHNGIEHQRTNAGLLVNGVDLVLDRFGPALIFHERQRDAVYRYRKLRHHRVSQHLGGYRRPIRNIKNVAIDSIIHFIHPE